MSAIPKDGIYPDMPFETYRAVNALNASSIKKLIAPGGAAKLAWEAANPAPATKALELGTLAHALVLEGRKEYRVYPPDVLAKNGAATTTAARDFKEEAEAAGLIAVTATVADQIEAMAASVAASTNLARDITPEVSVFWHETDGTACKARFDGLSDGFILDYKTCQDASPAGFTKQVVNFGYHIQAAFYLHAARRLGLQARRFFFLAQEKTAPYLCSITELNQDFLTAGARAAREGIRIWNWCQINNTWPGYASPTTLTPPAWMRAGERQTGPDGEENSEN